MKVGLIQVDGKMPNLALMKLSAFHKKRGDEVVLLDLSSLKVDRWYGSKVFMGGSGLDIRLINQENARVLSKVLYYNMRFSDRRLYFAFDDPALEETVKQKVKVLNENGIPSHHLMFYVLVGFNTSLEQDLHRIQALKGLGCLPFVMVFNRKKDATLRRLARWVNKRYYMVVEWSEFK